MANSPKLVRYPDHGRLLVAADLHGNLRDFLSIVARFEGMGDDAHLLFLGDLLHGPLLAPEGWPAPAGGPGQPPLRGRPYRDESPAIILGLQLLAERCPGRVTALLGNHEHAHIGGPRTAVFARDEAGALEQRLGIENSVWLASFLKTLPLWAIAPCGVLFSHAAPAAELASLSELEAIDYRRYLAPKAEARSRAKAPKPGEATARLFGQLLWEQALPPFKAQALLGVAAAQVIVYGHAVIPTGYQTIGYEQLILSSSFAMEDEHKKILVLDLGSTYTTVEDLRPGIELQPLY
jgi:hypothetical protein